MQREVACEVGREKKNYNTGFTWEIKAASDNSLDPQILHLSLRLRAVQIGLKRETVFKCEYS